MAPRAARFPSTYFALLDLESLFLGTNYLELVGNTRCRGEWTIDTPHMLWRYCSVRNARRSHQQGVYKSLQVLDARLLSSRCLVVRFVSEFPGRLGFIHLIVINSLYFVAAWVLGFRCLVAWYICSQVSGCFIT